MRERTTGPSGPTGPDLRSRRSNAALGSASSFNRIPFSVVAVAFLLGFSGFLAAVACVTPWFSESGTIPGNLFSTTFSTDFTPGPDGYIVSCADVPASSCITTAYSYGTGPGTGLLLGLFLTLLGAMISVAVLAYAGVGVVFAGFHGRIRVRRARQLLIRLLLVALVVAAVAVVAQPALQVPALRDSHACGGFQESASPCTSLSGRASGVGCQGSSCAETNVTWAPAEGWYFALVALGTAGATLAALRYQPLGAPCPHCGVENSFHREFCLACGARLPARPRKPYRVMRR